MNIYKRIFEDEESPFVYLDRMMYPIDNIHRARRSLITVHQIGTEEEIEKVTQAVKEKFPELLEVIKWKDT